MLRNKEEEETPVNLHTDTYVKNKQNKVQPPPDPPKIIPGYGGHLDSMKDVVGKTYGTATISLLDKPPKQPEDPESEQRFRTMTTQDFSKESITRTIYEPDASTPPLSHVPGYTGYIPRGAVSPGKSKWATGGQVMNVGKV